MSSLILFGGRFLATLWLRRHNRLPEALHAEGVFGSLTENINELSSLLQDVAG
jgi:hypothetical protein